MNYKRKNSLFKDLKGLPGFEEVLMRDAMDEPSDSRIIQKNCFFSTVFLILINSTFLPLLIASTSQIYQKIYYMGVVVSLIEPLRLLDHTRG